MTLDKWLLCWLLSVGRVLLLLKHVVVVVVVLLLLWWLLYHWLSVVQVEVHVLGSFFTVQQA